MHVTDVLDYNDMRGFVSTMERVGQEGRVFALDCEMCNTTQVLEKIRKERANFFMVVGMTSFFKVSPMGQDGRGSSLSTVKYIN